MGISKTQASRVTRSLWALGALIFSLMATGSRQAHSFALDFQYNRGGNIFDGAAGQSFYAINNCVQSPYFNQQYAMPPMAPMMPLIPQGPTTPIIPPIHAPPQMIPPHLLYGQQSQFAPSCHMGCFPQQNPIVVPGGPYVASADMYQSRGRNVTIIESDREKNFWEIGNEAEIAFAVGDAVGRNATTVMPVYMPGGIPQIDPIFSQSSLRYYDNQARH